MDVWDEASSVASVPGVNVKESAREKFLQLQTRRRIIQQRSEAKQRKSSERRARRDAAAAQMRKRKNDAPPEGVAHEEEWNEVRRFVGINDHLSGPVDHGSRQAKCGLEMEMDTCIKRRDYGKAEILSDQLAQREFGVRVAEAFSARRCAERRDEKEAQNIEKQTKTPRWGFEAKERWERKGNM